MSRRRALAPIVVLTGVLAVTGAVPADASRGPANGRVTFSRYDPALGAHSLWAADPDGQNQQLLATGPTSFSDWSPSGTHIAFDFANDTGVHIATIDATGGSRQDLTSAPGIQETPKWSPDGQWITYGAFDPQTQDWADFSTSIWVMRSDGSDARRVTHDGFDVEPVFSPDGKPDPVRANHGRQPPPGSSKPCTWSTLTAPGCARSSRREPAWSTRTGHRTVGGSRSTSDRSIPTLSTPGPCWRSTRTVKAYTRFGHPQRHLRYYKAMWSPDGKRLLMGCFDTRVGREQLCTATAGGGRVRIVEDTMDANWPAWGSKPRS